MTPWVLASSSIPLIALAITATWAVAVRVYIRASVGWYPLFAAAAWLSAMSGLVASRVASIWVASVLTIGVSLVDGIMCMWLIMATQRLLIERATGGDQ